MKKIIILLFLFSSSFSIVKAQNSWWKWMLFFDDNNIISEVHNFQIRVTKLNGSILDVNKFNNQIKFIKNNHYLDSLSFWVSTYGGIKRSGDTIKVLYDFKGNDLIVPINSFGPLLSKNSGQYKNIIHFEGYNSLFNNSFNLSQPFTMILVFQFDENKNDECIFSSYLNDDYSINKDKNKDLSISAKKKLKDGLIDNNKKVIFIEFNGDKSRIFINNELVLSGKLDTITLKGILLGKNLKSKPAFFSGYLYTLGIFKNILSNDFGTKLFTLLK